ncbi:MAG: hypothetical protein A2381_13965 [Bdellovibrionales bacterium RIFOXYB1_FULL_37_110]|nr:MAG: hypothetical protein A2181_06485 [Bdellovibrionales bacterium RIFOXYA1_FULL_38_20]OFZ52159.1 MAG: hypothetical protein A2417_13180 [Bdellovibrionales bacterium RIFOXYC1_FULL_37_79]OFZ58701.1 MAG: hypothetical protein A2381_13965 [Bdellovibrionales bacterium RIFOXYB1_FULL_37_110]OFZ63487.1 MAG: hypothetical protein A2577_06370 [Bdellovibrionales bacterium RIFOXYD1_FULL_36_51]
MENQIKDGSVKMMKDLKHTFNDIAKYYDQTRPTYPNQIFEDIIRLTKINTESKLLEVGCGTGQATVQFARKGFNLHAIDIGENLIEIAKQNCKPFNNTRFEHISLEEHAKTNNQYDLIFSACAFHWIPVEIRYELASKVLKDNGHLSIITLIVLNDDNSISSKLDKIYKDIAPEISAPLNNKKSPEEQILKLKNEIESSSFFKNVSISESIIETQYSSEEYIKLLQTFSNHRNLHVQTQKLLYDKIFELIESTGGIFIRKQKCAALTATKI